MKRILTFAAIALFSTPVLAVENIDAILAKADPGYGEYLSGECVTCHHQAGKDKGIPAIQGLEAETFVTIIYAYKTGELENKVMQLVSRRLDDEQIGSLAVYFAGLEPLD